MKFWSGVKWITLLAVLMSAFAGVGMSENRLPKYMLMKADQKAVFVDGTVQKLCKDTNQVIQFDKAKHAYAPAACLADLLQIKGDASKDKTKYTFQFDKRAVKVIANQTEYKVNNRYNSMSYSPYVDNKMLYIALRDIARIAEYKVVNLTGVYVFTRLKDGPTTADVTRAILAYENRQIKIPVLTYHHFSAETTDNSLIVNPDLFDQQMKYLHDQGYTTLSDADLVQIYSGKMDVPQNPVLITIDDGYESNYKLAYPILKKYNMKATVFLIVSRIFDVHRETLPYNFLDWTEVKEMSDSGLISFQSHTNNMHFMDSANNLGAITHPMVWKGVQETKEMYDKRVLDDLTLAKLTLEQKLGKSVVSFAYPFGHYNKHTEELVKQAGYKFSFSVKSGSNSIVNGPYILKRASVPGVIKVGMQRIPASFELFPDFMKRVKEK